MSISPNYFDTLQFQENTLFNIQKPSRRKKNFISENVYVGNLDPAVMTMSFGGHGAVQGCHQSASRSTNISG